MNRRRLLSTLLLAPPAAVLPGCAWIFTGPEREHNLYTHRFQWGWFLIDILFFSGGVTIGVASSPFTIPFFLVALIIDFATGAIWAPRLVPIKPPTDEDETYDENTVEEALLQERGLEPGPVRRIVLCEVAPAFPISPDEAELLAWREGLSAHLHGCPDCAAAFLETGEETVLPVTTEDRWYRGRSLRVRMG